MGHGKKKNTSFNLPDHKDTGTPKPPGVELTHVTTGLTSEITKVCHTSASI